MLSGSSTVFSPGFLCLWQKRDQEKSDTFFPVVGSRLIKPRHLRAHKQHRVEAQATRTRRNRKQDILGLLRIYLFFPNGGKTSPKPCSSCCRPRSLTADMGAGSRRGQETGNYDWQRNCPITSRSRATTSGRGFPTRIPTSPTSLGAMINLYVARPPSDDWLIARTYMQGCVTSQSERGRRGYPEGTCVDSDSAHKYTWCQEVNVKCEFYFSFFRSFLFFFSFFVY